MPNPPLHQTSSSSSPPVPNPAVLPHSAPAAPPRPAAARAPRRRHSPASAPIGRGSLTWKLLGDSRQVLLVGRTGVLQTMHPVISQALVDHSDYFDDPIARLARSAGPILGVIYDDHAEATAAWIRDRHRSIRSQGTAPSANPGDHEGSHTGSYRSLDPAVFYWAHATFFEALIAGPRLFGTPLTEAEQHQLYAESVTWWSRYGMTMAPVPADYDAFRDYWDAMFDTVLAATPVAADAMQRTQLPVAPRGISPTAWRLSSPLVVRSSTWLTRGLLPEPARDLLGLRWSAPEQLALQTLGQAVRAGWPVVPSRARYLPRARAAIVRAA